MTTGESAAVAVEEFLDRKSTEGRIGPLTALGRGTSFAAWTRLLVLRGRRAGEALETDLPAFGCIQEALDGQAAAAPAAEARRAQPGGPTALARPAARGASGLPHRHPGAQGSPAAQLASPRGSSRLPSTGSAILVAEVEAGAELTDRG
ncbi:hypothetical protein [Roseicella aquatilis]|uniref:Uncharacterized protein n=1 Tax=Roseicella aquatilis TaxID=2527868 RepID=A0A4R4DT28_9PROT|nr:hypothetical protein [Roseicella aquatilis]TCZ64956.1 hypothetical protein EXY23_06190 [Roseicella aquatilis]